MTKSTLWTIRPRANRLILLFSTCIGLFSGLLHGAEAADPTKNRPNILILVSDDQGWRDIGYHDSEIRTPNLDQLATTGVRLENHYVYPTCSPTRAGLLSGRNPSRFGILGPIADRSELALPPDTLTLARLLKDRGYATAITGKWHLGLRPQVGPRQYGFDFSYGYLHGQIDPYTHLYKNGDRTWHRNEGFVDEKGHATDLLADEAIRFFQTRRTEPFFLYVAFSVPHTPMQEEEQWTKPYENRIQDPSRRLVAASITHMDDAIGRMMAALDRTRQRANTLILFTSDNGGQQGGAGDRSEYGGKYGPYKVLGDNRPLRGWKGELYEGGIRVPAFVHWSGTLQPRIVHAPISVLDWLPTLARLVAYDVKPELHLEGQDVWPLLTGTAAGGPRTLYWKTPRQSAVRVGDWKLIATGGNKARYELFNLADDPYEKNDAAAEQAERVAQLREVLKRQQALDPQSQKSRDAKDE
jgi:arylsulfatase B